MPKKPRRSRPNRRSRSRSCGCGFTQQHAKLAAKVLGLPKGVQVKDLLAGMKVESEHRDITGCDILLTARIALAHLRERKDYYPRLKRAEH